jgi:hypothetical protein
VRRTTAAGSTLVLDADRRVVAGTTEGRTVTVHLIPETERLLDANERGVPWKRWGPYLSERQWGTVREDYSDDGEAWSYLTHDQARSRAYRWGEDGLGGICDDEQRLCFAVALWNGADPILKERAFGLTNAEGNHGEDVKDYYFYLDATPTSSYLRYLYKYPQRAFPYEQLIRENGMRDRHAMEYELVDTGVFDDDRYFDVSVDYAKVTPEDLLVEITVHNRGPEAATLHLLPTLWFRNTWSWSDVAVHPQLARTEVDGRPVIAAEHPDLGRRFLELDRVADVLVTENETNAERLWGAPNATPYVKDAFHRYVVEGDHDAVNPAGTGTKAAFHLLLEIEGGGSSTVRLRLSDRSPDERADETFGAGFGGILDARRSEAEEFYAAITPSAVGKDAAAVMRQALAGMLWSKQYYEYDLSRWLADHDADPRYGHRAGQVRNSAWFHMVNGDVISMPDTWEYPWYAAWDLAFHCIPLAMVDPAFAKQQLDLLLSPDYLHPNGQLPAYEWNFSDVNPPVHAFAVEMVYRTQKELRGEGDREFLERAFLKLLVNHTWWINRKDAEGNNLFQGGFLGLDNIGVFDRSAPLPTGGHLEQADGTAWMAGYSLTMFRLAAELATEDPVYEEMAVKFYEHFLWIRSAMDRVGPDQVSLWDEEDGFLYDVLKLPDGRAVPLRVRSMVGLLALSACEVIEPEQIARLPRLRQRIQTFHEHHPELIDQVAALRTPGVNGRRLLAALDEDKLRRVLARLLDESEFLSPHGLRSLSRYHAEHPYTFTVDGTEHRVDYEPAESTTGMFGGNSNWRGPIWFPVNLLVVRSLLDYYAYYGDDFTVECPTGSGQQMTLFEVVQELSRRLVGIFTLDEDGRRPVFGGTERFQSDPHWRDHLLFYEYFHGDNGAGLGASHQTGWTGVVARLIQVGGYLQAQQVLEGTPVRAFYEPTTRAMTEERATRTSSTKGGKR